jgi:hypothetical protein
MVSATIPSFVALFVFRWLGISSPGRMSQFFGVEQSQSPVRTGKQAADGRAARQQADSPIECRGLPRSRALRARFRLRDMSAFRQMRRVAVVGPAAEPAGQTGGE